MPPFIHSHSLMCILMSTKVLEIIWIYTQWHGCSQFPFHCCASCENLSEMFYVALIQLSRALNGSNCWLSQSPHIKLINPFLYEWIIFVVLNGTYNTFFYCLMSPIKIFSVPFRLIPHITKISQLKIIFPNKIHNKNLSTAMNTKSIQICSQWNGQ